MGQVAPNGGHIADPALGARSHATQTRILDAAVKVLVDRGYAGASTLQIQHVAGVSRGSLLHHFGSRDELLVAAVSHLAATYMTNSGTASAAHDDGTPERIDAAVADMWSNYQQDHFWAATELWLAARHSDALAAALRPVERSVGELVQSAIRGYFGAAFVAHPTFDQLQNHLNTSMRGVALTYSFNGRRNRQSSDSHVASWCALARTTLLDG